MEKIKNSIWPFLSQVEKILLIGPRKISNDEICGILALQKILTKMGKKISAVIPQKIARELEFLGTENLQNFFKKTNDFVISISTKKSKVGHVKYTILDDSVDILVTPENGNFSADDIKFKNKIENFDAIFILGADNLESLGEIFEQNPEIFSGTPIINFSASATNEFFGKVNFVDPNAVSVCEILLQNFLKNPAIEKFLDKNLTTILLTGIISATESFAEFATENSFLAAGKLQKMGAAQSEIIENLFKKKPLSTLKIWGQILQNLEFDENHKISWSHAQKKDFEIARANFSDLENFNSALLRHIKNADFSVIFVEREKKIWCEICSSQPTIDFSAIKKNFSAKISSVKNGILLEFSEQNLSAVEKKVLQILCEIQKSRLNLPENLEIKKWKIAENFVDEKKSPPPAPKIPAEIPFEIPPKK